MKPPEYLFTRETKETRATTVNFNPFRLSLYVSARFEREFNQLFSWLFIYFFFFSNILDIATMEKNFLIRVEINFKVNKTF